MKLIKEEKIDKQITEKYSSEFTLADDGLCLIEIIASAKSWRQNIKSLRSLFKDDDLALILDKIEITTSTSNKTDVRAAWNGNELKGLTKTVIVAVKLKKGKHVLNFIPDQSPYLKSIAVKQVEETNFLTYFPTDNNPAEKGDRRPWLSFIIINLAVRDLIVSAKADKRGRDDDDIKIIIDGEIQKNQDKKSHQDWYWCGKVSKGEKKEFKQAVNFTGGLHTIDLWADESPYLEKIELVLLEDGKSGQDRLSPDHIIGLINELYKEIGLEVAFARVPKIFNNSFEFDREINQASQEFNIEPNVLKATLAQESSFGRNIDHDWRYIGESGLMGLEKKNAIQQLKNLGHTFDYNKIIDVIRAAAAYYKWLNSYQSKKLSRFKNLNSPLKIYTQYASDLNAINVTKPGIKEFLYYYFYYKNQ